MSLFLITAEVAQKYKKYFKDLGILTQDDILNDPGYYKTNSFIFLEFIYEDRDYEETAVYSNLLLEHVEYNRRFTCTTSEDIEYMFDEATSLEKGPQVCLFFKDNKSMERLVKYACKKLMQQDSLEGSLSQTAKWLKYEVDKLKE